jgi:DtxR family transcriptional regulator, Mn-dependent transcriptional regulator
MAPEGLARRTSRLTQAQEDYLKAIYLLGGRERMVSTSAVAQRLKVAAPSATEMLGKLAGLGLVIHDRYHGTLLSAAGAAIALEMVRHHRLIEMYLTKALGYRWDEVHEEAERLEHHISERLEERMFDALGHPDMDPHGDPIPTLNGEVSEAPQRALHECRAGESVRVLRVSDSDPEKLRVIERLGLRLGTEVAVLAGSRYEGPISVSVKGRRRQIPLGLAKVVYVA